MSPCPSPLPLEIRRPGLVPFDHAWREQDKAAEAVWAGGGEVLFLLQHPPVYTTGRSPDRSSLGDPERLPAPVFEINRGGLATYHGPGQLVGYPILNLGCRGRDLHAYLRFLEDFLGALCSEFGVKAQARPGLTGLWVEDRKLASIGVGIRRWITQHGFALNVCNDLAPFTAITPCGLQGVKMTSLQAEAQTPVSFAEIEETAARLFPEWLERRLPWKELSQ